MSKHSLFSYYENKSSTDVAHLKDAPGVATGNPVNTEEFRRNDILSSLESKDGDISLKDIILKIEAVHEHVHRLKTWIDTVISENPGKVTSVNKLSMHEPSDGLNQFGRYPSSPASARSKNAFPVRSVKTEFNMGEFLMPGNEVSSCVEMSPLIEITSKPQHEVLWEDASIYYKGDLHFWHDSLSYIWEFGVEGPGQKFKQKIGRRREGNGCLNVLRLLLGRFWMIDGISSSFLSSLSNDIFCPPLAFIYKYWKGEWEIIFW